MVAKTRRHHRKSRNGCAECKRRHIRCDERQPSCTNCEASERTCSFLTLHTGRHKQKQAQQERAKQQRQPEARAVILPNAELTSHSNTTNVTHAGKEHTELPSSSVAHLQSNLLHFGPRPDQALADSVQTQHSLPPITGLEANLYQIPSPAVPLPLADVHTPPADCCPGLSTIPNAVSKAIFTPQHMVLMHYANTVPNLTLPNRSLVDIAVRRAIDSPYLLDEILAFTAFHMARLYPGSAVYLQHLATELQNRALASFTQLTDMVAHDDKASAVPRFLFSAILGRHVLADTLAYCRSDFNFFIDRFVECINLNRGIRVVTPPAWEYLYNTEVRPFLSVVRDAAEKITSPGHECDTLRRVLDNSDLNEVSVKACRQATDILQWSFDLCRWLDEEEYPQSASVFSVRVGAGFVDVLRKHRPEALLILSYYGVLLYRCRSFWAFGDAGAFMIHAIAERLGTYWQEPLAWPLQVLDTEPTRSQ